MTLDEQGLHLSLYASRPTGAADVRWARPEPWGNFG
jgi:hypothetical protein